MTVNQLILELGKIENKYLQVTVRILDCDMGGSYKDIDEVRELPKKAVIMLDRK